MSRLLKIYGMEALGLAIFMIAASLLTLLLFYPGSVVARAVPWRPARDVLLAAGMFPVFRYAIIEAPWGVRSGAVVNPAVALALWRVGLMRRGDAVFYAAAQFLGATIAVGLIAFVVGKPYTSKPVQYVVTMPGPEGAGWAFVIEFLMTFVLVLLMLWMMNSPKLESRMGLWISLLISAYLAVEIPYTGMSLNPARSFGSAVWAGEYASLWIYFAAPLSGAWLAAGTYLRLWPERLGHERVPPPKDS